MRSFFRIWYLCQLKILYNITIIDITLNLVLFQPLYGIFKSCIVGIQRQRVLTSSSSYPIIQEPKRNSTPSPSFKIPAQFTNKPTTVRGPLLSSLLHHVVVVVTSAQTSNGPESTPFGCRRACVCGWHLPIRREKINKLSCQREIDTRCDQIN